MTKRAIIAAVGIIAALGAGCTSSNPSMESTRQTVQTTVRTPQQAPPEAPPNIPPPTPVQNGHATE